MIQAGSVGAPYIPVLGLVGTDLLKQRDDMKILPDPFNPEVKTVVAKAYRPDFAIFHAQKADRRGNVSSGWNNDDTLLAEAARHVIVTVEEVVEHLEENDAKGSFLPGILVNTVVHAPFGAHPAGCPDYYQVDAEHMKHYAECSTSDEAFQAYLEETTFSVDSHQAYVERFVPAAWRQSEAGPTAGATAAAGKRDSA
jgi:glutaconate CoA-transferase subunit A